MTNEERILRGMANNDLCTICLVYSKSIMHVIRDCEVVKEMWNW